MNNKLSVISFQLLVLILFSLRGFSQDAAAIKFSELEKYFHKNDDTTYVINFWATWCSPCVEELPYFEKLNDNAKITNEKLRIILVSLDFKSKLESKVNLFIRQKNIRSQVLLLDETDANSYIDKVSKDWSGAIPVTLIVNSKKNMRQFFQNKFDSFKQLDSIVVKLNERN